MWIRPLFELAFIAPIALITLEARATPPTDVDRGHPDEDPLATYRERFRRGMDRYKVGAVADAVAYWEPIYRELGEQKGYRLAYNLGVAYEELGEATHAAERLQSFLDEVDVLRARGEGLPSLVEKELVDARARITDLIAIKGRIHVEASRAPRSARIDAGEPRLAGFIAWVTPGDHTVTFAQGTPDEEATRMHVRAGEIIDVAPKATLPPTPAPAEPVIVGGAPPTPPPTPTHRELVHPFPWPLIAVSGGVAVAAGIAALPLYIYEGDLYSRYAGEAPRPAAHSNTYNTVRTLAYMDVGGAIGFAVVTAGLATWYFLGTSERAVLVTPSMGPESGGASLRLSGRF